MNNMPYVCHTCGTPFAAAKSAVDCMDEHRRQRREATLNWLARQPQPSAKRLHRILTRTPGDKP